ncbi:MAG: ATP-binding protein, partial [Candidatus Neomarinimicrobiota bacterium]
ASAAEQERLGNTLRSLGDGVIAVDSTDKVVLMNQMAGILLERKESDVLGKRLGKIFPLINSNDDTERKLPDASTLKPKQTITFERDTVLLTGKDHRLHIAGKIEPMITSSGDVSGLVISFYDNTNKELLEAEQLKNQKLVSLETFSSGLALDFNNHLSSIALNLSAMQLQTDNDPQLAELLKDTEESIKRARGITSQLATFTQGARPAKDNVLLSPILKETVHQVLQGSDVEPSFHSEKNAWPVAADVDLIGQVILHLTRNAAQAMELGGNLRITIKNVKATEKKPVGPLAPGKYVQVAFEDEGIGFSPEIGKRIYDPYFTTRSGASGLGLFLVHNIINQHDGWITFQSQVDKGTKFTFYLPAVSNVVATPMEELPEFASGTGSVLILDSDALIRNALRRFLRSLGYTVGTASTPDEASAKLAHALKTGKPFNVVFIDLALPDGTRAEKLLDAMRKHDREIKAILTAGTPSAPEIVKSQEYGFQGRLIKPYNATELSRVLAEMLPAVPKS